MNNALETLSILQKTYGSANWLNWSMTRYCYYDYVRLSTSQAMTEITWFDNVAGTQDPVSLLPKTREQTNLPKPKSIGNDIFVITEFRFDVQVLPSARNTTGVQNTTYLQDRYSTFLAGWMQQLLNQGVFEFWIDGERFFELSKPFETCPPGFGPAIDNFPVAKTGGDLGITQLGARPKASQSAVFQVDPPQLLEPERQFTAKVGYSYPLPSLSGAWYGDSEPVPVYVNAGLILEGFRFRPQS